MELLAFNFASRTFAYLRLAQGLSRSLSSFSSFMREYLDRVIKADKCAQYVDDIGIATHTAEELKNTLREVFQCIREAGLRLTMAKCQFGAMKSNSLDEQYHLKALPHNPTRSEITSKNCRSQKPKRAYKGTLDSLTNTGTTYLASPKKSHPSTS